MEVEDGIAHLLIMAFILLRSSAEVNPHQAGEA